MKPDEQQTSGSYIGRILIDGATPFLYRSAVRSLLGLPESRKGNTAFKQNLPPVGFRYSNPQWMTDFNPAMPSTESAPFELKIESSGKTLNESLAKREDMNISQDKNAPEKPEDKPSQRRGERTAQSKSQAKPEEFIQSRIPRKKNPANQKADIRAEPASTGKYGIPAVQKLKSKKDIQHQPQITGKKLKTQTSEKKAENEATPVDKSQVDIPGFTKSKLDFPALTASDADNTHSKEASTIANAQASSGAQDGSAQKESPRKTDTRTSSDFREDPVNRVQSKKKIGLENEPVSHSAVAGINENQKSINRQTLPSEKNSREFSLNSPTSNDSTSVETTGNLIHVPATNEINRNQVGLVYRTNKANTQNIEQLKRRVDELAAKNSKLEEQIHKNKAQAQKQERHLPQPSKEPVVVEQRAKPSRTPSAFWERSYLSRFHLKMLR